MDLNLSGKTAAIVGGASGIGKAVCLALSAEGCNVGVIDKDLAAAETTVKELKGKGSAAVANLKDFDSVSAAFAKISKELGSADIMVFADCVANTMGLIKQTSPETWDNELDYTLSGAFHCIRAAGPSMKERKWGRIITISNRGVTSGAYGQAAYIASMAGLFGLTKTAALEYARANVTCNILLPGLVDTPAYRALPEGIQEKLVNKGLTKRLQTPEEIASVIIFLCSDYAKGITGAEVDVTMGNELFVF